MRSRGTVCKERMTNRTQHLLLDLIHARVRREDLPLVPSMLGQPNCVKPTATLPLLPGRKGRGKQEQGDGMISPKFAKPAATHSHQTREILAKFHQIMQSRQQFIHTARPPHANMVVPSCSPTPSPFPQRQTSLLRLALLRSSRG